jgi:hypothetical protein
MAKPDSYKSGTETEKERLDRNWGDILQELRVTQTGTQILTGFLLALAFQQRFTELSSQQLNVYLVLVGLAGLSTALGLAPVILHRTFFRQSAKEHVVMTGSRLLLAELIVVGLLAIGVTSFVFDFVVGSSAGLTALVAATIIVLILWVVLPRLGQDKD